MGKGLSPRLRGNHYCGALSSCKTGSIPAPAGEPKSCPPVSGRGEVYPRACGGTINFERADGSFYGLSPRLRGNRLEGPACPGWLRSIPAPAGEPGISSTRASRFEVYPRACGGTGIPTDGRLPSRGLSPRLRGNLAGYGPWFNLMRSIPAPAGEPALSRPSVRPKGVYPRACGGTAFSLSGLSCSQGLSPRLRGNLFLVGSYFRTSGSIPAPAGEP